MLTDVNKYGAEAKETTVDNTVKLFKLAGALDTPKQEAAATKDKSKKDKK